jgi:hypothetical protein
MWPFKKAEHSKVGSEPDPWVELKCSECGMSLEVWIPVDYPTDDVHICVGCYALDRIVEGAEKE